MLRVFHVLFSLFAFLVIVFSVPAVQTYLGKKITNKLNKDYGVDIAIGRIGLTYAGGVRLKEIFVKDHHQDTLLYASGITTSIGSLTDIANNKPELGDVAIEDLIFNMKIYKDESSDNLMTFIRKFNSTNKSSSKEKFLLTTKHISISEGRYNFIDENLSSPEVINYSAINLAADNLMVDDADVYLNINALTFKDKRGLRISKLQTCFSIKSEEMNFQELSIETPDSNIQGDIQFSYKPGGLSDFVNKVKINAIFNKATVSTNDLIPFYKEFGKNHNFKLKNTSVRGTLNDFRVLNANISGLDRSSIKGDIRIRNSVTNVTNFELDGDFDNVTTNYYDLINLLPNVLGNSLPKQIHQFGSVMAIGNAIVTRKAVDVDMNLFSQLGKVNAFVLLENLNDLTKATYNGNIISNNFNVGQLVDRESIGNAAFDIHVDGSGFTLESLDTKIEGDINKLDFNGYTYTNLKAIGNLKDRVFDGDMSSRDPNAQFNFKGVADLSEEVNNYDFVANVDHVDLHRLNIFTRDSVSVFNGDVYMNIKGTGVNDAFGTISFAKTLYRNQNAGYYFEDFDITSDFDKDNVRTIKINSPDIIEGNVKGVFRFENVYDLFRNSIGSLYTNFEATEITDHEFMEFNFSIYNKIIDVFFPEIQFAPNTIIKGKVESDDSEFKLTFKSPSITAYDNYMENIDVQVDNKNPLFNTYVAIDSIDSKYYDASEFSLINVTLKDTLFIHSEFKGGKNNDDNFNLEFYHTINEENNSVVGFRKSDFTYKGYTWYANREKSRDKNKIVFDNDFKNISIQSIMLDYNDEAIRIDGVTRGKDYKNLTATFDNVDLNKVTPRIDSLNLKGKINGELAIIQENSLYLPNTEITINDLTVNETLLGQLQLKVDGNSDLTKYNIDTKLSSEEKQILSAVGLINVSDKNSSIAVDVDLDEVDISGFSALGGIVVSNIRGFVSGQAKISGSYKNPNIDGVLTLNKSGLTVPYLNVDLDFEEDSKVLLSKQKFDFDNVNITDTKYDTKGILSGFIAHRRFSKWELGLKLLANDRLLVLDTEEDEESLYYGTGFISGEAEIKGPTDGLVIDVNATTEKGTSFKIPLNETESIGDNSYIHFLSQEEKRARLEGKEIVLEDVKGLELNFDLDVNNNAEVEIVIDKNTGSSLKGRGAGTLLIEINTNGKFKMWGDFVAYEGTYNFRYGPFVEKLFTVRDGGTINWSGSPTRAVLDLSAVYKTEANPAILLESASINRKIPVEVVVDLQGELIQPNINFNIEFPNLSSVAKSELDYRLSDQSTKELQALSLVSSGQFYSGTLDANAITGGIAAERVSGLFNSIFSDEDDKFQVGLNYVQGVRTLDQENADQFGLTLSTQINNKILINGRVGVPIGGANDSGVIGDVEIEYLFNEDGSLRGKVFNRQNDIQFIGAGNQIYEQGVGLSYSVDFDNFNELWTKIFKTKKVQDSIAKPGDTIKIEKPDFINFTEKNK